MQSPEQNSLNGLKKTTYTVANFQYITAFHCRAYIWVTITKGKMERRREKHGNYTNRQEWRVQLRRADAETLLWKSRSSRKEAHS